MPIRFRLAANSISRGHFTERADPTKSPARSRRRCAGIRIWHWIDAEEHGVGSRCDAVDETQASIVTGYAECAVILNLGTDRYQRRTAELVGQ